MSEREIYVSVDLEADGPCPGLNSMLSLAAVAFEMDEHGDYKRLATWTDNLEEWPNAQGDPDTLAWWRRPENRQAWLHCRRHPGPVREVMSSFVDWLKALPGKPICVCYPAGFDWVFIYFYLHALRLDNPFVRNAVDIETFAMALTGGLYLESDKKNWRPEWKTGLPHTHVAIDDAIEQGESFMRMLRTSRGL